MSVPPEAPNPQWYNPFKVMNWVLEALLIKDPPPTQHAERKKPNVFFVLGGPGSGKGTNCTRLAEDYKFVHLSAGDLLREEQASGSERGQMIAQIIKEGQIVPMEVTIGLLRSAMRKAKGATAFLIDGFPRKMDQGIAFEDQVCPCKGVLFFDCPEEELEKRLLERGKTSGRADDCIESIKKRFHTYVETSRPVIDTYAEQNKVFTINSCRDKEEVYADVQGYFLSQGYYLVDEELTDLIKQLQPVTLRTIHYIGANLLQSTDEKYRTLNIATAQFSEQIGQFPAAMRLLTRFGFEHDYHKNTSTCPQANKFVVASALRTLGGVLEEAGTAATAEEQAREDWAAVDRQQAEGAAAPAQ